jgi:multiple sugar transport system permease protein
VIVTPGFRWFRRIGLTFLTLVVMVPVFVLVSTSVKPLRDVRGRFEWIPSEITFSPYVDIWSTVPLLRYFINSAIVTTIATAISVVIAIAAAYAIARMHFHGRRVFSMVVLSTQMFPGILFLLPLYLIFVKLKQATGIPFTGSYLGLIITYLTFALPFSIWMLSGYFASIPRELEEAAMIDGTGRLGALLRIMIPVAKPGIIAVAVFAFNTAWGEVLFASVLTSNTTRTLTIGLQAYSNDLDVYWNQLMAASVVVSVPLLIAFFLVQRHLVTGLSAGAVK